MGRRKKSAGEKPKGIHGESGITLLTVETLKVLISLSGMSQRELATACDMTESQVSEYLSGVTGIGPKAVAKFAVGLRVDPHLLARAEGISLEKIRNDVLAEMAAKARKAEEKAAKIAGAPAAGEPIAPITTPAADDDEDDEDPMDALPVTGAIIRLDRRIRRHLIRSIAKSEDNTEPVQVYRTAAGRPDDPDSSPERTPAYVPKTLRHAAGKARLFGLRVHGDSMVDAGIEDQDIVFARRSSGRPADGRIVVVHLAGEGNTCKRLRGNELIAESPTHEDIKPLEDDTFAAEVLGIFKPEK